MNWWNQYVSANVAELTGKSPICVVFGGESWWKSPECAVSRGAFQMVPLQQLLIQHCMPAPTDPPHHSGCQTTPESRSSHESCEQLRTRRRRKKTVTTHYFLIQRVLLWRQSCMRCFIEDSSQASITTGLQAAAHSDDLGSVSPRYLELKAS